ncbi:hypothetical protein Y1Q_0014713 [Alligator mississippiensis]|uniref:Uncharacterized protein n=1 Tax=Alligator mississippiensis TaxID=8496 RepID=A0A151P8G3_ALLMI|nr:hypothetical protein Y1Q_0014713 [Alligator mississippiensis]
MQSSLRLLIKIRRTCCGLPRESEIHGDIRAFAAIFLHTPWDLSDEPPRTPMSTVDSHQTPCLQPPFPGAPVLRELRIYTPSLEKSEPTDSTSPPEALLCLRCNSTKPWPEGLPAMGCWK